MSDSEPINELIAELSAAISARQYDEVERLGHEVLDLSPSEEADRFIHDIISSATTIRDAEDEIRYQLADLKSTLESDFAGETDREIDGL